jgi:1-aminocyclopropane-1-carboxylate deaminase
MPAAIHAAIAAPEKELFSENHISFFGLVKISRLKSVSHAVKIELIREFVRGIMVRNAILYLNLTMPQVEKYPHFFGESENDALAVLRIDLPDPLAGGNKSYKLKYNLEEMKRTGFSKLITFGGAFSNHIAAVAHAGKKNNFETIGIIRGDELTSDSNTVLKYASACGMQLIFISREEYRKRNDADFIAALLKKYGPSYLLPEGGSNEYAVKGCKEILSEATDAYDVIICPVGTGATLAGIIGGSSAHQHIIGIAVLNGKTYLENEVSRLLKNEIVKATWEINHDFTFGGYANTLPVLSDFIAKINSVYQLPLDLVYSGKALFAIAEMQKGEIFRGKRLLFIHTGGYAFSNL